MTAMSSPNPAARSFVRIAILGGAALFALTLLWIIEVIDLPVFIGGLVVIGIAEMIGILGVVRRMPRPGPSGSEPSHPAGTESSHLAGTESSHPAGSDATGRYGDVGYDPMAGLPGATRPTEDR